MLQIDYLRSAVLERDMDDIVFANILEALDKLQAAEIAIDKALTALETNPITGRETAWTVLKVYVRRYVNG